MVKPEGEEEQGSRGDWRSALRRSGAGFAGPVSGLTSEGGPRFHHLPTHMRSGSGHDWQADRQWDLYSITVAGAAPDFP
ncbi:MAG: hypothetical protein AMJ59_06395 [Gammaproteobacteria bacterium SG8_31]|nr:MAG: hypothetical protein AMJ59_06395 [Gammaproteobacteria bacterium SG8_31]